MGLLDIVGEGMKLEVEEEFDDSKEYFEEGETSLPPSTELTIIEETFGEVLDDPQAIRNLVREKYVPGALLAYDNLLHSSDPKIRKATADTIMEIADVKGINKGQIGGNTINFNLGKESEGMLYKALAVLSQGEIVQEAEIVEE